MWGRGSGGWRESAAACWAAAGASADGATSSCHIRYVAILGLLDRATAFGRLVTISGVLPNRVCSHIRYVAMPGVLPYRVCCHIRCVAISGVLPSQVCCHIGCVAISGALPYQICCHIGCAAKPGVLPYQMCFHIRRVAILGRLACWRRRGAHDASGPQV